MGSLHLYLARTLAAMTTTIHFLLTMSHRSFLLLILVVHLSYGLSAQVNQKGTIHASIGAAIGGHATEYDRTVILNILGFPISLREVSEGGAATTTYPIEFHYGIAPVFSLGAYYEPGIYVDSNDTRNNRLHLIGLQPRFYLINKERFAWMASAYFGTTSLRIEDNDIDDSESKFKGGHFGVGSGVLFLFSERVGLQLYLRYLGTNLDLKEYSINGDVVPSANYDGTLRTSGGALNASLCFRF